MNSEHYMDLQVIDVARVCHEANRTLQIIQDDPTIPVSEPWESLDEETRDSAVQGVEVALAGASPEESHENWVRFKVQHGWTRGPVKDMDAKEHPLLVPYAELPAAQKVKDALFLAIVEALGTEVRS